MLKNSIFLTSLIKIVFSLNNADYCNIDTCQGMPHTVCTYRSEGPATTCGKVLKLGLTSEEKEKIVNLHNELRQKVARGDEKRGNPGPQPKATNMQQLKWDDELADIAQTWANQCQWGHDKCRNVQRFNVGQNIAYHATTEDVNTINIEDVVRGWYNEVKDYNANSVSNFGNLAADKQVYHYTQFVWADTNKLGCGAIKHPEGGFNRFYLVCNYGPAGNFFGQSVYKTQ